MLFTTSDPYKGMKNLYFKLTIVLVVSALAGGCADRFPSRYVLELPEVSDSWVSLLGEPLWRAEWIDPQGQKMLKDIPPGSSAEIEIPTSWANPVTAWPYWENHGLNPGLFKPAGAIFPFDASGETLCLSWKAGPDAVFYMEMLFTDGQDTSLPANFDWPRFRELFSERTLSDEVCEDPWLVNWRSVAERTVSSGFDRRRLVPEASVKKTIPVPSGVWYGTSPFAKPLSFAEGKPSIFPARPGINVWISGEGILRMNGNVWVLNQIRN